MSKKSAQALANFNPRRLAYFEKENYVAYYRKRWLRLLVVSVSMVKEAYQLSLPQAVYAASLVARAEMAAAPFPDNDIPTAEGYMRRFYRFLAGVYGLDLDVERIARLEVTWWVVHRRLFAVEANQELVQAVADLYAAFFGLSNEVALPSAAARVRGMFASDRWVRSGLDPHSPLLTEEEGALCDGYELLKVAVMKVL